MNPDTPIPVGKHVQVKGGHSLHYHEVGSPSADKPSILFLHGSGPGASGYSNFKGNFPVFADAGYHVLAPDYLGYGLSSMPADIQYSTDMHVEVLHEFLQAVGVKSVVPVGNSLGGAISLQFTLTYPHMVPKLILMAPGGLQEPAAYAFSMTGVLALMQFLPSRPFTVEAFKELLGHLVHDKKHITEDAISERFSVAQRQPLEVYSTMKVGVYQDRLHEIACPILAFWGSHDEFLPVAHGMILIERCPKAKLVVNNQCGHWVMTEDREYFNAECLAFLNQA